MKLLVALSVFVVLEAGLPAAATSFVAAPQASDLRLSVFARPLGLWCDGTALFTVGLINQGTATAFVAVPTEAGTTFPYKSTTSLSINERVAGGGSAVCGCSEGDDCELCAKPEIIVPLGAGRELTWTMEFQKIPITAGPASFRVTLYWFGGRDRRSSMRDKLTGTAVIDLAVERLNDRCFAATVNPKL